MELIVKLSCRCIHTRSTSTSTRIEQKQRRRETERERKREHVYIFLLCRPTTNNCKNKMLRRGWRRWATDEAPAARMHLHYSTSSLFPESLLLIRTINSTNGIHRSGHPPHRRRGTVCAVPAVREVPGKPCGTLPNSLQSFDMLMPSDIAEQLLSGSQWHECCVHKVLYDMRRSELLFIFLFTTVPRKRRRRTSRGGRSHPGSAPEAATSRCRLPRGWEALPLFRDLGRRPPRGNQCLTNAMVHTTDLISATRP